MVPEALLERTDVGLVRAGEDWFVVNAREARWFETEDFGRVELPTSAASSYTWTAEETDDGKTAYAQSARSVEVPSREGRLPS